MAQAVFNKKASELGIDVGAFSAGLFADGAPMSSGARAALADYGIADFEHTSKQLTSQMISDTDYVVGISARHALSIAEKYPEYSDRIFAFPTDIKDPFGMSTEVYKETLREIESGIDVILSRVFGK